MYCLTYDALGEALRCRREIPTAAEEEGWPLPVDNRQLQLLDRLGS